MTLQVHTAGPGVEDFRSTRFAAAVVDGSAVSTVAYVNGASRQAAYTVPGAWNDNDTIEVSQFTFGASEGSTIEVSLVDTDQEITTFEIYPKQKGIVAAIQDGALVIVTPTTPTIMRVEVNDNIGEALFIHALGLKDSLPVGVVDYDPDSMTEIAAGTAVRFPAGVHYLPAQNSDPVSADNPPLFPVGSNTTVYFDEGSIVVGSFDPRGSSNVVFKGRGHVNGSWTTYEDVQALATFDEQIACSLVYYESLAHGGCSVTDIVFMQAPFYSVTGCFNVATRVGVYSPWTPNTDGLKIDGSSTDSNNYSIVDCSVYVGDDALDLQQWRGNGTITGNLLTTTGSCCFLFAYDGVIDVGYTTVVTDNYVRAMVNYYTDGTGTGPEGGEVIKCWVTGATGVGEAWGRFSVTIDGLWVEGAAINSVLFWIGNRLYPWGTPGDGVGQVSGWTISNVYCEAVPAVRSKLKGLDGSNGVSDIEFTNVWLGSNLLTTANFSTYVETNAYAAYTVIETIGTGSVIYLGAPTEEVGAGVVTTATYGEGSVPYLGAATAVQGAGIASGTSGDEDEATVLWAAVVASYSNVGLVGLTNVQNRAATAIDSTAGENAAHAVIDLWPIYAQADYDPTAPAQVEVAKQAVIAMLWRRGGSATTIEQVKWTEVFADDGLIAKVKRTGARGHAAPSSNSGVSQKSELVNGRAIRGWSDRASLPINYLPRQSIAED